MKGAAKKMTAFTRWKLDKDMKQDHANAVFTQIEFAKQETRVAPSSGMQVPEFLKKYNHTDCHAVSALPPSMAAQVELPELIKCGYATTYLDVNNLWMSSGGTDSVIHNDDQDNVNCVLSGTKRFFMVDARNKTHLENEACGWMIAG